MSAALAMIAPVIKIMAAVKKQVIFLIAVSFIS
jgi:hypothetical protein